MKNLTLFIAASVLLGGCASIMSGTMQDIEIKSTAGASYTVNDRNGSQVAAGMTPATVQLNRGMGYFKTGSYKINLKKPGYHPRLIDVTPSVNGWYWANIAIPGNIWWMLIVDPSTGAMYKLAPSAIEVELEPSGEPLDSAGNLAKPLALAGDPKRVSLYDYEAQQVAKGQRCSVSGNGAFELLANGVHRIAYRCSDNRALQIDCATGKGCQLSP
ncbi:hypothetical protein [Dokdonella sp.]|uniref:hypothetical protein n=1 Tax=Dokdonella sp. TaxID=2291710 RepID=UPI002DD68DA4|nr:hypothetical protein [Dokdonella sp.]